MMKMPNSLEIESSLLGAMIYSPKIIEKVLDELKEENFYDKRHGILFKTINSMALNNCEIDIVTLANKLKDTKELEQIGGITYLTELSNLVFTTTNIDEYIKIIKRSSKEDKL